MAGVGIRLSFLPGFAACYSSTGGEPADGDRDSAEEIRGDIVADDGREADALGERHDGDAAIVPDDGLLDEGVPDTAPRCGDGFVWRDHEECDGAPPRGCTSSCETLGEQACVGCMWEACRPPAERCDGADDDCDGEWDEGCSCRSVTWRELVDCWPSWGLPSSVPPPGCPPYPVAGPYTIADPACFEAYAADACRGDPPVVDFSTETVLLARTDCCAPGCEGEAWGSDVRWCDGILEVVGAASRSLRRRRHSRPGERGRKTDDRLLVAGSS